ncbi:MAG: hypothetical protein HY660_16775 [Armatimonadetes bacterium]|nr:hypothetical protein [Armatimonadota bacterium]
MTEVTRRRFLRALSAIPVLGTLATLGSAFVRFLKPNVRPFDMMHLIGRDVARGEPVIAARLSELREPWNFKYFVFAQKYPQYTAEGSKVSNVPGVIIRLPTRVRLPWRWAGVDKRSSDIVAFSRICPHLGCIFNYVGRWQQVTAGYGGYVPPQSRRHAVDVHDRSGD